MANTRAYDSKSDPAWPVLSATPAGWENVVVTADDGADWAAWRHVESGEIERFVTIKPSAAALAALEEMRKMTAAMDEATVEKDGAHAALVETLRAGKATLAETQSVLADLLERLGHAPPTQDEVEDVAARVAEATAISPAVLVRP